jgi:putative FmdB family regulatory protein
MPFYDYHCGACGHQFEAMQKMSADPLTDCPECGKPELVKQVSAGGFRVKGSAWSGTEPSGGGHSCGSGGCSSCG